MNPLVTVIIPSYNHEKYIKSSIISVVEQSYGNIELIVIDDGSSDNSPQIIAELRNKYDFSYIRNENQGLIKTLKYGLSLAQGKYISLVASDDIWLPGKIEKQVDFLESNDDVSACFGYVIDIDMHGNEIGAIEEKKIKSVEYDFNEVMLNGYNIPPATIMFNAHSVALDEIYDERFQVEDLYSWLKLTESGLKIVVLPHVFAKYRTHPNNMHANSVFLFREHGRTLDEYKDTAIYRKAKARWSCLAFTILATNEKLEALKYFKYAMKAPFDRRLISGIVKLILKK